MSGEPPSVSRPKVTTIEVIAGMLIVCMLAIRLTVLAALVVLALLYIFFPLHRSRRALTVTFVVLLLAVLIPVDIYVPGVHGPLEQSKHSGLRLVQVLYGLGAQPEAGEEVICGGCIVRIHRTRWIVVWD